MTDTKRNPQFTLQALRRIDLGYRNISGLSIHEQAYGMRSEAKYALETIARLDDGLGPSAPPDAELWPGRINAARYFAQED